MRIARPAHWARIRNETDQAFVYCYDRRLTRTGYGKRLMQGLPLFTVVRHDAQGREVPQA